MTLQSGPSFFGAGPISPTSSYQNPTSFGNLPGTGSEFGNLTWQDTYGGGSFSSTLPSSGDYYGGPGGPVTMPGMSIYGGGFDAFGNPTAGGQYDMGGSFVVSGGTGGGYDPVTGAPINNGAPAGGGGGVNPSIFGGGMYGTGSTAYGNDMPMGDPMTLATMYSTPWSINPSVIEYYTGANAAGGGPMAAIARNQERLNGGTPASLLNSGANGSVAPTNASSSRAFGSTPSNPSGGPNWGSPSVGIGGATTSAAEQQWLAANWAARNSASGNGSTTMANPSLIPGSNYGNPTGATGAFNIQNAMSYYNMLNNPLTSGPQMGPTFGGGTGGATPTSGGSTTPANDPWSSSGLGQPSIPGSGGSTNGSFPANGTGNFGSFGVGGLNIGSGFSGSGNHLTDIFGKDLGGALSSFLKGGAGYNPQVAAALIAQMQPLEARGRAQVLDAFGDEGLRFSSTAAIGLGDFESQFAANEQATLAKLYESSVDRYASILMGLTGAFQSANAADMNTMDWLNIGLTALSFNP